PGMAPGTGTPEPGGLTSRQLLDAVRRIAMELPLAGVDVVEVAPPYDHAEVTAFLANRVVLEALSGIAWRRRSQAAAPGRQPRSPADPLLTGRGSPSNPDAPSAANPSPGNSSAGDS
ncbi:MAG TPA: arginase family protein, partial [Streptosporangiaceae bacterium]